ncbi:hypothetical protein M011DRAFT_469475 [Sporormia fimetaria CBS 119925]|uniref:Uncharacterized protein n=1 Tax=Sporormia fimetaria CBS 119925 TaxID=1340428 RepID=A0A6A6V8E8_9PLEO|nr:hypothetical protein M011DRAFT_469475 [Sporormia fimetaria CBS 119925]
MDPSRYRKAYEALLHVSELVEARVQRDRGAVFDNAETQTNGQHATAGADDTDAMEWTPTGAITPPTGCGPLPSAARNLRRLFEGEGTLRVEDKGDNAVLVHKMQEGIIMDECIDKLIHDLPDVLNYEDSASFTPSTIEVPRDFDLQLSLSINHHLAQVADRKLLEKYRRLLGHRRDASKRKALKLGFDPVDLVKKNAVTVTETPSTLLCTLDNDIHPIFRIENFHACPDAIYDVLKPALRLSTLLVFSRASSAFWHTLVFGERKFCAQTSQQYGQTCRRIREDVPWSEQQAAAFRSFVDDQVDTVHFIFHRSPVPGDQAYASMGLVADYKNGLMRKLGDKCLPSRICLHADFYTVAKKLSLLQYPDPGMVLRFNLFLAICIAHEMAHFIEVSGPHHERPLGEPEVFINDNKWTESGVAFELKIFGGRLHPISQRVDCSLGLAVLSYPLRELYEKEDNILYTIPMDYITKLQRKETWEQDLTDPPCLLAPRTGGKSVEVNGTNLMVWEDEKDADISDQIDGRDTQFHRLDDGQIVRNQLSGNRKSTKHIEGRRFNPYNRINKNGTAAGSAPGSKESHPVNVKNVQEPHEEQEQGTSEDVQETVDKDEDML